jgi:hypothetical protein
MYRVSTARWAMGLIASTVLALMSLVLVLVGRGPAPYAGWAGLLIFGGLSTLAATELAARREDAAPYRFDLGRAERWRWRMRLGCTVAMGAGCAVLLVTLLRFDMGDEGQLIWTSIGGMITSALFAGVMVWRLKRLS